MRRVLIVGAGIGGDCLAVLLDRAGWEVTVAELSAELRSGGQTVDLRGPSADVLADMGLLEACRARLVPQAGIAWIDAEGRPLASMPVEAFGGQGFVSKDELLRTDLAAVLHEAGSADIDYRFSDTVERLEPDEAGVTVTFERGDTGRFDLVVGADGTHSRVRALTFGPEEQFRQPLGLAHAWFTLHEAETTPTLDGWFLVHNAPGSRLVEGRPGHSGQQEIGFTFPAGDLPDRHDRAAQYELLDRTFSGMGWRTHELLAAARAASDFALDTFDQIHLDRWTTGRIALLGDSAWCASPLSGLGTSLALQGAAALAAALTVPGDTPLEARLARYEAAMRPRVTAAQQLLPGRIRTFAPRTRFGIRAAATLMRLIQTRPVGAVLTRLWTQSPDSPHATAVDRRDRNMSARASQGHRPASTR